jgi:hypothetical protein
MNGPSLLYNNSEYSEIGDGKTSYYTVDRELKRIIEKL